MSDFGQTLSTRNGMMCYKERHALLLECVITFLRCIRMIRGTSESIYSPPMVYTVSFVAKTNIKFHEIYQILGTLSEQIIGFLCHKGR